MQNYISANELQHWGIKGMKWGVRRFQRKDGSLTPEGKKRYDDDNDNDRDEGSTDNRSTESSTPRPKSVEEMSDAELREKINRLNMEKQYRDLMSPNSDAELRDQINRLNLEKQYRDLTTPNKDAELREKINHLNLEKQYKDLTSPKEETKISAGKQFISNVIKQSGENIASQLVTFAMGEAVNVAAAKIGSKTTNATLKSILDPTKGPIVNSKKGQKPK